MAMVRDLLGAKDSAKIFSLLLLVVGASPMIVGLPESYPADRSFSLKPGPIVKNFMVVLKTPQFLTYSLTASLAFASLFAYVSGSPIGIHGHFSCRQKSVWLDIRLPVRRIEI
jgi:DHA1 family bicyclomycin/chloramphenicol resistance-like MFS transporter